MNFLLTTTVNSQQARIDLQDVLKTFSRHLLKKSSAKTSSEQRFLVFQDILNTSWRRLQEFLKRNCYAEVA